MNQSSFQYGEEQLTIGIALEIANGKRHGLLSSSARAKIQQSRNLVDGVLESERIVYGVTTGFGPLCTTFVSGAQSQALQHNLLKSHSVGVGEAIPKTVAKLMLILKVQALAQGYSGISLPTLERILWHIEEDLIPFVPAQGSVGASGDLAPLSHLFLPLIGFGQIYYQGNYEPAAKVLQEYQRPSLQLQAKEGLALINGTQFMAAYGIVVAEKLHTCLAPADIIAALMIEGLKGSSSPFLQELHAIRPYKGNVHVAKRVHHFLKG